MEKEDLESTHIFHIATGKVNWIKRQVSIFIIISKYLFCWLSIALTQDLDSFINIF